MIVNITKVEWNAAKLYVEWTVSQDGNVQVTVDGNEKFWGSSVTNISGYYKNPNNVSIPGLDVNINHTLCVEPA